MRDRYGSLSSVRSMLYTLRQDSGLLEPGFGESGRRRRGVGGGGGEVLAAVKKREFPKSGCLVWTQARPKMQWATAVPSLNHCGGQR